ncbi:MAG TPA: mechanosensitive ion channel domain-containing protein [Blastocatellia bacterium]|nr:mechanosensitive ion channel domain-containing protein [Blastocatellia bacterium]
MDLNLSTALEKIQVMANGLVALLPNLALALIVFAIFFFGARWLKLLVGNLSRRYSDAAGLLLGRLVQVVVVVIGLLVALSIIIPTFKAGDLIQLLGITSVAIGFAFRDIFQNFLAGILLLLTRPFRIGDQIVVRDFEGTVEDIQTRATLIRTYDGRRVVIPNSDLFTESVTVNTAFPQRRSEYELIISNREEIDRARNRILEAIRGVDGVLGDPPPDVIVTSLKSDTTRVHVRWWTEAPRTKVVATRDRVITAIRKKIGGPAQESARQSAA